MKKVSGDGLRKAVRLKSRLVVHASVLPCTMVDM